MPLICSTSKVFGFYEVGLSERDRILLMTLEVRLRLERNGKPLYIKFVILAVGELSLRRISV